MRKLLLTAVLALAIPSTAGAITFNHALLKLPSGANCLQATSPPCQMVSSDGFTRPRIDNAIGLSGFNCNNGSGCFWYPGGVQYGQFTYNVCTCNPSWGNAVGNVTVQGRQACPNGIGYKFSAGKTMYVDYATTPFNWFGTLQIIDNGGCQPS